MHQDLPGKYEEGLTSFLRSILLPKKLELRAHPSFQNLLAAGCSMYVGVAAMKRMSRSSPLLKFGIQNLQHDVEFAQDLTLSGNFAKNQEFLGTSTSTCFPNSTFGSTCPNCPVSGCEHCPAGRKIALATSRKSGRARFGGFSFLPKKIRIIRAVLANNSRDNNSNSSNSKNSNIKRQVTIILRIMRIIA